MAIKPPLEGILIGAVTGVIVGTVAGISTGFSDQPTLDSLTIGLVISEIGSLFLVYNAPRKNQVVKMKDKIVYYGGGFVATGAAYTGMFYNAI